MNHCSPIKGYFRFKSCRAGVSNLRPAGHLRPPEQILWPSREKKILYLYGPQEQWSSDGSLSQLLPLFFAWDWLRHTSPTHSITAVKHQLAIHVNKDI